MAFRHGLLWPLRLEPLGERRDVSQHWAHLAAPWARLADEIDDPAGFGERHYREFVTFLPYVQRLLYGEGRDASSVRVYRRRDVARMRVVLEAGARAIVLDVAHVDLHFFYDIDVVILNVEVAGAGLPLDEVQEVLLRFGCAFPPGWDEEGRAVGCPHLVELLAADGAVLARSDYDSRERFVTAVHRERMPTFAAHWKFLLAPMVPDRRGTPGTLRYRLIDDFRIPMTAFLAVDDLAALTRADYVRLACNLGRGDPAELPYAERFLADFEAGHCVDRFHDPTRSGWVGTRLLCTGNALVMVGGARTPGFVDGERGELGRFRHEYFLITLLAHFHKATLLMLSDRLAVAVNRLDVLDPETVRWFKREIRHLFEVFLRFTHRYWFREISEQTEAQEIFALLSRQLEVSPLYDEVERELRAMAGYLDSDSLRRQANTLLRLTVVTIFGLTGTVATGMLGMNIFAMDDLAWYEKTFWFALTLGLTVSLTIYTIVKSKRLSDFLDALSDERVGWRIKAGTLLRVWWR